MKKIALFAAACAGSLLLAACGNADDASSDAMAEDVEMPADEAMANTADPATDPNAATDEAAEEAAIANAENAADAAEAAVADVQAAGGTTAQSTETPAD